MEFRPRGMEFRPRPRAKRGPPSGSVREDLPLLGQERNVCANSMYAVGVGCHRHLWPTANDLEKHMWQRINDSTRGPAPMLYACDAEPSVEAEDEELCTNEVELV